MNALRAYPLVPAATVASAVSLASLAGPLALVIAALAMSVCGVFSVASLERMGRLAWGAAALAAALAIARVLWVDATFIFPDPLGALRATLAAPIRRLIAEPEGAIVIGIVLGERDGIPRELAQAFAESGTTHLLAISGFNMTLVAGGLAAILRGRAHPTVSSVLTVATVGAYCLLVGPAASVLRAGLMAAVACLGTALGRPAAGLNALAAAVSFMLVLDPAAVGDAGFLLSVSATLGLLLFQQRCVTVFAWAPSVLRDNLAATCAASVLTLPIVVGFFGRLSLVAPLANVLAVPLFAPLMVAGIVTSALGALALDLGRAPALVAYAIAFLMRTIVERSAALPLSSFELPEGPPAAAAIAAALGFIGFGLVRLGRVPREPGIAVGHAVRGSLAKLRALPVRMSRAWVSAACCIVVGAIVVSVVLVSARPALRIRALDVGQGDAFLIETAGRFALIDGGPDPARLLAALGASLPPWHRRLDLVALTHAHLDHGAGLIGLFERFDVGLALEPEGMNDVPLTSLWRQAAARAGVPLRALGVGDRVRLGSATLTALSPNGNPRVDVPSLVLRFEHGPFSMLFPGDATDDALADLLLSPAALAVDVYVPPHHGATTPHGAALVKAAAPDAAVLSVGASNRYGHPTPETLRALAGIAAYRTDRDGTVEIEVDGGRFSIRTHANGLPPARGRFVPYAPAAR